MKKNYQKPAFVVVQHRSTLLVGSGGDAYMSVEGKDRSYGSSTKEDWN